MISIFGSKKRIQDLEREIAFPREQLQKANEKIAQLEERLAQYLKNSRNSSKPPSSDGPQDIKPTTISKKADKRKPGGQPGHPGHSRKLLPEDQVDDIQQFRPEQCRHCRWIFDGREETNLLSRHQQYELKDKPIQVTESRCLEAICPQCGKTSRGDLPGEWRSGLGTNLLALTAILTAYGRVPRRMVQELLSTVLQLPISLGSVQAAVEEAGEAAGPVAEELRRQLPQEAVLNVDETGWRCQGKKAWLWVFVASRFVYYWIDPKRHRAVMDQVLGEAFAGALCSDRWAAYLSYHQGDLQLCWAHLKRDLLGMVELIKSPVAVTFAKRALRQVKRMFEVWHGYRSGGLPWEAMQGEVIEIGKKLFSLSEKEINSPEPALRKMARLFFLKTEKLYLFAREAEGVEPTNNRAERAIRCAVQWRKTSFGNRGEQGKEATARLLTLIHSCRMQDRNPYVFMVDCIRAHRRGTNFPSLLSHFSEVSAALR